jgi:hypothetical protein
VRAARTTAAACAGASHMTMCPTSTSTSTSRGPHSWRGRYGRRVRAPERLPGPPHMPTDPGVDGPRARLHGPPRAMPNRPPGPHHAGPRPRRPHTHSGACAATTQATSPPNECPITSIGPPTPCPASVSSTSPICVATSQGGSKQDRPYPRMAGAITRSSGSASSSRRRTRPRCLRTPCRTRTGGPAGGPCVRLCRIIQAEIMDGRLDQWQRRPTATVRRSRTGADRRGRWGR